jgi:Mg2+ and Co2+ transporter CorA
MATPNTVEDPNLPIIQPKENELLNLTHAVVEWKKMQSELGELRAAMGERRKKMKALEDIILRIMKNHNIGALDLKNSGGRVLYKKKKAKSSIAGKNLEMLMAQFFNSQERAVEVMKYIDEHREVVTREGLAYVDA